MRTFSRLVPGPAVWPGLPGAAGLALIYLAPGHRLDLLLIGAACAVGAMAYRPTVGPLLVGLTLPLYFFPAAIGPLSFSPPGLTLVLAWLALTARTVGERMGVAMPSLVLPRSPYDWPLALFLLAAVLSFLPTEYPRLSVQEARALILEPVLFFWLLLILRGHSAARTALVAFLFSASVVALVALGQVATGLGGTAAEGVRRAQAWYPSPNHLALLLGRGLPFLLAFTLANSGRDRPPLRWLVAGAAGVVTLAIGATFSLGGWLGTAAGFAAVLYRLRGRRPALAVLAVTLLGLIVVTALAAAGILPERLNPVRGTGAIRVELWAASLRMALDHPLLGIGLDNFVYLYQQVYLREGGASEPNLAHPHNWLLHFWLQLGLAGLIAFCWLLSRCVQLCRQLPSRRGLSEDGGWRRAGILGALTVMLVHGLLDNSYFLVDLAFLYWLFLALAVEAGPRRSEADESWPRPGGC